MDIVVASGRIEFDQFYVVIKKMNGPRIALVRIYPKLTAKL